ncbi:MAG: T9SS type A sorting domain-containing protein, partial [Bacteroidota bacterium]
KSSGGWGFGGGGAGDQGAGGGGGYSGGAGGGAFGRGGGGGSYTHPEYTFNDIKKAGGNDKNAENGKLAYTFYEVCDDNVITGFEYISFICEEDGPGRIQLLPNLTETACGTQLEYELEPNNGHNYFGNGIFRNVKAGTYRALLVDKATGQIVHEKQIVVETNFDVPLAKCKNITVQLQDGTYTNRNIHNLMDNGSIAANSCHDPIRLEASQETFDCLDLGERLVTLSVTGDNGSVGVCGSLVTVEVAPEDLPMASCKEDFTVELSNSDVAITPEMINDNPRLGGCSENMNLSVSPTLLTCNELGTNEITLTISDEFSNTSTCTSNITLVDPSSPIAQCKNGADLPPIVLDDTGNASIDYTYIDNGSSDNCNITYTLSQSTFDCTDIGVKGITLTVTDNNNRSRSCNTGVQIVDQIAPTAICQDLTVSLDEQGQYALDPAILDGGSTDECTTDLDFSTTQTGFNCNEVGDNELTITVSDASGNSSSCTSILTVEDNTAPQITCKSEVITYEISPFESFKRAHAFELIETAEDACGSPSIFDMKFDNGSFQTAFSCADQGQQTITISVADRNGNIATCEATVEVIDNTVPSVECKDIEINLEENVSVMVRPEDIDNGSYDNCDEIFLSILDTKTTFTFEDVGEHSLTLQAINANRQGGTCEATVTVIATPSSDAVEEEIANITPEQNPSCPESIIANDNVAPTALCKDATVQLDGQSSVDISPELFDNNSSDNCGIVNYSLNRTSVNCEFVGSNSTITLTVTDANGNSSNCTSSLKVEDNFPPIAHCDDVTIQLDDNGNGILTTDQVDFSLLSDDNCGRVFKRLDQAEFGCSDVGQVTEVTMTVTDDSGNESTCTSNVLVEDNTAPVASCNDLTIEFDTRNFVTITTEQVNNNSTDNCGIERVSLNKNRVSCEDRFDNNIILTVTDVNGNSSTCQPQLTIVDLSPFEVDCEDRTIRLNDESFVEISFWTLVGDRTFDEECDLASATISQDLFTCGDIDDEPVRVTVRATDKFGNSSSCISLVTLEDVTAPSVSCIPRKTIQLNANGEASIQRSDIFASAFERCGLREIRLSKTTFNCSDIGLNTITVTATDRSGNIGRCTTRLTVEENPTPTASCQDATVQLDASGNGSITAEDIDNGSSLTCGTVDLYLDITEFDCSNIGENTVTLTVYSEWERDASCTATVTVEDNIAPQAICQDVTIQMDAEGQAQVSTTEIDNGSNDVCGIFSLTLDQTQFDCSNLGSNTVTLIATDNNENTSTCTANVSVEDNIAPTAVCNNIVETISADETKTFKDADLDGGSFDNCGIASITSDRTAFATCIATNRIQPIRITVTDLSGNTSSCNLNFRARDITPPTITCKDITVTLNENGVASVGSVDIVDSTNDDCEVLFLTAFVRNLSCSNIGEPFTIGQSIRDPQGNRASCSGTVTVIGPAPIAECKDANIQLDMEGSANLSVDQINNGSSDVCGIANISLDQTQFDCSNIGSNTVTLTVTNGSERTSTCTANVNVLANNTLQVACKDLSIQLDVNGEASIKAADVDNNSSDPCGISSITLDKTDFNCSDQGTNTVTLTVTNSNNQSASCTANVTIEQSGLLPDGFVTNSIGFTSGDGFYNSCERTFDLNTSRTASFDFRDGHGEFTYVRLEGDFSFTAELHSLSLNGIAGLMVRTNESIDAQMGWVGKYGYGMTGGVNLHEGDRVINNRSGRASRTIILTVTRSGDVITFKQGRLTLLTVRMSLPNTIQVGMFLSSSDNAQATAQFKNVSFEEFGNISAIASVPLTDIAKKQTTQALTLNVWPNPSTGVANLQLQSFIGNTAVIRVYDLTGKVMYSDKLGTVYENQYQLDLSSLEAGMYMITIESAGQLAKSKWIKQ